MSANGPLRIKRVSCGPCSCVCRSLLCGLILLASCWGETGSQPALDIGPSVSEIVSDVDLTGDGQPADGTDERLPDVGTTEDVYLDTDSSDVSRMSDAKGKDLWGAVDVPGADSMSETSSPGDAVTWDSESPTEPVCDAAEIDGRLVHGPASPLVKVDPACGKLSYGTYAAQGEKDAIHILPDFSHAGYMGGGVALPDVPGKVFLEPIAGDNGPVIQAAIDQVSLLAPDETGFRGAVVLAAGTYAVGEPLIIQTSGVVLRGAGQGSDGTILVATKKSQHDLISLKGSNKGLGSSDGATAIATSYVPVGAKRLKLASSADFMVGDLIGVKRTPNQVWIDSLEMGQWGWTASSYAIVHENRIVAIDEDHITLDVPIVDAIQDVYGGGVVFKADLSGRIQRCGIEDLRLESEFSGPEDEEHGWIAVKLSRVMNSWVRRVTAVHFGYAAVSIHNESKHNTVEEVAQLDPVSKVTGGRRYSFNVSGGTGNLFQRCFARGGRHNFVTGSRVTGPNVWLDCLSVQNNSDEGPHHRWATGLLFDNCMSKVFNVQNRKDSGTGHGWAGAQTLFWNILATGEIRCDAPLAAMNWVVGSQGTKKEGSWAPEAPFGWWESEAIPVEPRSLYFAQLADRLGIEAVNTVASPAQLDGPIWGLLSAWAGKGLLADVAEAQPVEKEACQGIQSGSACCPLSCGVCGGPGCSQLPGGAENCCTSAIKDANKPCSANPPPCVVD